ncbi:YdcF family protein [Falsiroseomonas bella]|uniref:YdcF family protein n=1 Tax=Falsiroseomonas bella TaxID=2184016 RepID=A0A317FKK9_9PROT|nr:YdcF family protein [Falsiroseomonas bella]PWS38637.1 YdcF family protein [Falsiroseomonas bella]
MARREPSRVARGAAGAGVPTVVIMGAAVLPGGVPSQALADRVAAAHAWGEARPLPPRYMPTGGVGRHPPAESAVMARLLREAGVAADRITQEPTGTDTLSSVLACVRLLRGVPGPVFVATHRYHLPRTLLLFRLAGVPARPVPPPPGPAARASLARWRWRLREIPALPYDAALMLWARLTRRA